MASEYKSSLTKEELIALDDYLQPDVREAKKRNAKHILPIFFFLLLFAYLLIAMISFISMSVNGLDAQFGLGLFYTISLSVLLLAIYGIQIYCLFSKENLWPLFDKNTQSNYPGQLSLNLVPMYLFVIQVLCIWFAYAETGGSVKFGTENGDINACQFLILLSSSFIGFFCLVRNLYSLFKISPRVEKIPVSNTINTINGLPKGYVFVDENGIKLNDYILNKKK